MAAARCGLQSSPPRFSAGNRHASDQEQGLPIKNHRRAGNRGRLPPVRLPLLRRAEKRHQQNHRQPSADTRLPSSPRETAAVSEATFPASPRQA